MALLRSTSPASNRLMKDAWVWRVRVVTRGDLSIGCRLSALTFGASENWQGFSVQPDCRLEIRATLGRLRPTSPTCGRIRAASSRQHLHASPQLGRTCAKSGATPADYGRHRQSLAKFWLNLATSGPIRPKSTKFGRIWATFGCSRVKSAQHRVQFNRSRPNLANSGPASSNLGPSWPYSGQPQPKSPRVGRTYAKLDPIRAAFGQDPPTSAKIGPHLANT